MRSSRRAPSAAWRRTKAWTRSSPRFTTPRRPPREADRGEHGHRRGLDSGLPRGAAALPELAHRPALRSLRRRELPRLRRAHARILLRAAPRRGADTDDLAADPRRLPGRVRGARRLRADPLAAHRGEALR